MTTTLENPLAAARSVSFFVPGIPQPGGSKRAFHRPGMRFPVIVDANPKAKDWKGVVAAIASQNCSGELLAGALCANVTFFLRRPASHYGSGRNSSILKPSAPKHPTSKPDATKLWRSTEDALTGIIWTDDSQIVDQRVKKKYAELGQQPGAQIRIDEFLSFE